MASTRQTWVSIVIAGVIVAVMLLAVGVGGAALFVHRHVSTRFVPADTAAGEFATARARFAGQTPMLEIATDEVLGADAEPLARVRAIVHRDRVAPGPIHALHVLAYDPQAGKLVRADVPRWVLQLSSLNGRFRIANLDVLQGDRERVTLEDFDGRGPGLVMNMRRGGGDVVVWTD